MRHHSPACYAELQSLHCHSVSTMFTLYRQAQLLADWSQIAPALLQALQQLVPLRQEFAGPVSQLTVMLDRCSLKLAKTLGDLLSVHPWWAHRVSFADACSYVGAAAARMIYIPDMAILLCCSCALNQLKGQCILGPDCIRCLTAISHVQCWTQNSRC